jgi:hypothetical protein
MSRWAYLDDPSKHCLGRSRQFRIPLQRQQWQTPTPDASCPQNQRQGRSIIPPRVQASHAANPHQTISIAIPAAQSAGPYNNPIPQPQLATMRQGQDGTGVRARSQHECTGSIPALFGTLHLEGERY